MGAGHGLGRGVDWGSNPDDHETEKEEEEEEEEEEEGGKDTNAVEPPVMHPRTLTRLVDGSWQIDDREGTAAKVATILHIRTAVCSRLGVYPVPQDFVLPGTYVSECHRVLLAEWTATPCFKGGSASSRRSHYGA